jgi:hypothetical protein
MKSFTMNDPIDSIPETTTLRKVVVFVLKQVLKSIMARRISANLVIFTTINLHQKMSNSFTRLLYPAIAFALLAFVSCSNKTEATGQNNNAQDSTITEPVIETAIIDPDSVTFQAAEVEGRIRFKTGANKYGFFGSKGDTVVAAKYDMAFDFKDGFAKIKLDGKFGFINTEGVEVVPPSYNKIANIAEGKAAVEIDGKWGFIDMKNKLFLPAVYDSTQPFGQGLAPVLLAGATYWSYVDPTGKVVISDKMKLESAWPFAENLAHGMIENHWGYFDKKGKTVIPFIYLNAGQFKEGSAPVQTDAQWMRIDKKGKCVMNCEPEKPGTHSADDGHDHEGHDHSEHDGHDH